MNKRLEQFLKAENISQSQFADTIGVARANISHIIAGRNKPGFDFLQRMSKHYPSLNLEWLITGKGRMFNTKNLLFDQLEDSPAPSKPIVHESARNQNSGRKANTSANIQFTHNLKDYHILRRRKLSGSEIMPIFAPLWHSTMYL